MYLICGLGNPEKKYFNTYHNVGFLCVDALGAYLGGKFSKKTCNALVSVIDFGNTKIILAKPQTYMNLSGESVSKLQKKFKIKNENVLIIYDDVDLEPGRIRFRECGSGGTHNGMKNVIERLGTTSIARLRIGIGNNKEIELADYVLSQISTEDNPQIQKGIADCVDFIKNRYLS